MRFLSLLLKRLWASPYSLLGLGLGAIALMTGGGVRRRRGAIEIHGGLVKWLLGRVPIEGGAAAMVLGHTILGLDRETLDVARDHEHVHVRQYERWGPFFGPVYLLASVWVGLRGGDPYRDNPFECEAYDEAP